MRSARADGDRDLAARIGALAKPSLAAWLVDLIARESPEDLQRVLDLGEALRQAQEAGDRDRLRQLTVERRTLLSEVARAAASRAEEAGQRVGDAVLEEVQQTLQAALASPEAAAAVRTGRLVRALDADGLDPVDLADAVAGGAPDVPSHAPRSGRRVPAAQEGDPDGDAEREAEQRRAQEREERERRLRAARDRADEAAAGARGAAATAEDRRRDADDLRRRVDELQGRLEAAEHAQRDAEAAAAAARTDADDAAAEVDRLTADD